MIMKTTLKFLLSASILFALVFTSCKKDDLAEAVIPESTVEPMASASQNATDGENGTDGSNGEDGTDGSNGTDGSDGENGADGSDGDDGADGQDGADGEDGSNGEDGADGADGEQGAPGPAGPIGDTGATGPAGDDGSNGANGADGNANVNAYTYSIAGRFPAKQIILGYPSLTKQQLESHVILVYLRSTVNGIENYYQVPGTNFSKKHTLTKFDRNDKTIVDFLDVNMDRVTVANGVYNWAKVIIIAPTSVVSGKSGRNKVLEELKSYGVDLNDYTSVMDYYGLKH